MSSGNPERPPKRQRVAVMTVEDDDSDIEDPDVVEISEIERPPKRQHVDVITIEDDEETDKFIKGDEMPQCVAAAYAAAAAVGVAAAA